MADSEANSERVFEVDRIRSLVELMKEFDLREIDLKQANQRIRLCRGPDTIAPSVMVPSAPAGLEHGTPVAPRPAAPSPPDATKSPAEDANIVIIKSPMVGTFFARPSPNAEPLVAVGDQVDQETTVCIIEAMKVFNEIPAEVRGRVVAILVDDEESVEFGKPLFKIDTSA